jgi:cell division septation protein DedD
VLKFSRLAHHTQDDGFHEIQLNGKQLVFLFMMATVVSVVIFLCGVLVGRGVRAERGVAVADAASATSPETVPSSERPASGSASTPADSDPRTAAPPPAVDDLDYQKRLENQKQPKDDLTPAAKAAPATTPQPDTHPQAARTPPPSVPKEAPAKAAAPAAESTGDFAVQVAALNARGEADAIAKRLASKGYAAYVVAPGNGAVMYRVRVGHFKTRHDAEPVFAKLQKEEQFKPWITR